MKSILYMRIVLLVLLLVTLQAKASKLYEQGKDVYMNNCIACHNADPSSEGSIGPAVDKSSKELVEARVLHASYPKDYKPKRNTHIMYEFPQLKDDIDAITAYLNDKKAE
jgi:mono/diheme cytochrome c family protein